VPRRLFTVLPVALHLCLPCSAQESIGRKEDVPVLTGSLPKTDEFSTLRAQLLQDEEKELIPFRQSIEQAIEAAPQVAALAAKLNAALKRPKKDPKRIQQLREQLLKDFPGAVVFAYQPPFETDPLKIKARLSEALQSTKERDIEHCFDAEKHSFSDSPPCRERLSRACITLGTSHVGALMAGVIDENLAAREVPYVSEEHLKEEFEGSVVYVGGEPSFCRLASLAGVSFKPRYPAVTPLHPRGAGFPFPVAVLESLRDECFDVDIEATRKALQKLDDRFPIWAEIGTDRKIWLENLDARERICPKVVREFCQNTYVLSGQVILAYRTKDCEVREVTAEDVDADVKKMAELGFTRAEQLNHAQLKETISGCQVAQDRGFTWRYVTPSTEGCAGTKSGEKSKMP
jgi:hypothetical protein